VFGIVTGTSRDRQKLVAEEHIRRGVPERLARRMAALLLTRGGLDIADLSRLQKKDVLETAKMYTALSDQLGIIWLHRAVEALPVEGRWQAMARSNLREEFYRIRRDLAATLLRGRSKDPVETFDRWMRKHRAGVQKLQSVLSEMKLRHEIDFAALSVASQELRKLISS
jgi:glutamate dehydrogenase